MLNRDEYVERRGEFNIYKVVAADDKFALLRCVLFSDDEDLGDGITCTEHGQEIWVAQYHAPGFDVTCPHVLELSGLAA